MRAAFRLVFSLTAQAASLPGGHFRPVVSQVFVSHGMTRLQIIISGIAGLLVGCAARPARMSLSIPQAAVTYPYSVKVATEFTKERLWNYSTVPFSNTFLSEAVANALIQAKLFRGVNGSDPELEVHVVLHKIFQEGGAPAYARLDALWQVQRLGDGRVLGEENFRGYGEAKFLSAATGDARVRLATEAAARALLAKGVEWLSRNDLTKGDALPTAEEIRSQLRELKSGASFVQFKRIILSRQAWLQMSECLVTCKGQKVDLVNPGVSIVRRAPGLNIWTNTVPKRAMTLGLEGRFMGDIVK